MWTNNLMDRIHQKDHRGKIILQPSPSLEGPRSLGKRLLRLMWASFGMAALSLAVLGIFIPGLPTTPFVLLAAACFSRSSVRLHNWLRRHPRFGQLIHDWENGRKIRRKAKVNALIVMGLGMVVSSILLISKPVLLVITLGTVTSVAIYVWTRPE
jgi:uncharacterized protein